MREFGGSRLRHRGRWSVVLVAATTMALVAAGCSGEPSVEQLTDPAVRSDSPDSPDGSEPSEPSDPSDPTEPSTTSGDTQAASDPTIGTDARSDFDGIVIDLAAAGRTIDRRVLGTNVPAWLGPDTLASDWFREAVSASGVTTLRFPGGSWSNYYDWAGCEAGDPDRCFWTWAARPTDFVDLMSGTGLEGIWTVSINDTAESAAAAVAFFNGDVDDDHVIGVDRDGVDWGTTSQWAQLRATGGHAEPANIELWEVGNEVFGGTPESGGDQCAAFGWEDVWTCDGTEYVLGVDEHDGYADIRKAMRAVDADIAVGAVGVAEPDSWSNWGNEVIEAANGEMDFYVVHQYGFDGSPSASDALGRPLALWPSVIDAARSGLPEGVPVAITEYNLVSFEAGDIEQSMTRAINALYIADTIGQFIARNVPIANQWNMANGTTGSGTDYGLIDAGNGTPFPQFEAMRLWGRTGDELLETTAGRDLDDLRVYATRHRDGTLSVVLLNLGDDADELAISMPGNDRVTDATLETHRMTDPAAESLETSGSATIDVDDQQLTVDLPAWSMSLLEVAVDRG